VEKSVTGCVGKGKGAGTIKKKRSAGDDQSRTEEESDGRRRQIICRGCHKKDAGWLHLQTKRSKST
jgi:hypothetical protein